MNHQTQSVIIYRSQSEKALDDAIYNHPEYTVPIFSGVVIGVVVFTIINKIFSNKIIKNRFIKRNHVLINGIISILSGLVAIKLMWI